MPVQTISKSIDNNLYCHVYNSGIINNIIFKDEEDSKTFLDFLKEYLSKPCDTESSKKVFNIRGHAFRGTPHQIKNYYQKIELVAFCLSPNNFHLLLNLKHKNDIQSLIRSLCTRYSIYFNKKYHRVGSLFQGPYKSIFIKDEKCVLYLTRYLHTHGISSYPEYLGTRITPWVKPHGVLSYFDKIKGDPQNTFPDYKFFVEVYKLNQNETELIKKITFEEPLTHFKEISASEPQTAANVLLPKPAPEKVQSPTKTVSSKPKPRVFELIVANTLFFFLLTLGISNVNASPEIQFNLASVPKVNKLLTQNFESSISKVLGAKTKLITPVEDVKVSKTITIDITDGQSIVDIYKAPNVNSEKITQATHGNRFELVSEKPEWDEIKLTNGTNAFIQSKYVK